MTKQYENRYCCTPCMATTRHSVEGQTYCCLRCGKVKQPTLLSRIPQPQAIREAIACRRGVACS
jgi:hypothetical protein